MTDPAPGDGGSQKPPISGRIKIVIWVVLTLLPILIALNVFKAHRRVETNSEFCASSCHHPRDAGGGWHSAGHEGVACQQCHKTSASTGFKLLWQTVTKPDHPQSHGKVDSAACSSCHDSRAAEWTLVAQTQGHRAHQGRKDVSCLSCHKDSSHGKQPPEKACLDCHKDQRLHKATTSADAESCLSCHSFAVSEKLAQKNTTEACERCHSSTANMPAAAGDKAGKAMMEVNEHVLHGDVACQLCHNAHGIKARPPEGKPVCARCHQFEIVQTGAKQLRTSPEGHRKCDGCHEQHAPLATALDSCVNCHQKNVLGLSPKDAAKAILAKGLPVKGSEVTGNSTALKHKSCTSCHQPHAWRAERNGCMQCHKEQAQLILTRSPAGHNACTNCHEVHGAPPTGAVCVTCHQKTKGRHVALAPERHKDCTSCHNPHAPSPKETRTVCAKCHQTQNTQVLRDGPEGHSKTTCFGCHQPHENPRPPATLCTKCHAKNAALAASARPAKHRVCASCHEKHVFRVRDISAACSSCHSPKPGTAQNVAFTGNAPFINPGKPHGGDCKECHSLHGTPEVAAEKCAKCHEKALAKFKAPNPKHAICRSCHEPHKPSVTALDRCATCHEAKVVAAKTWPEKSKHAQACNGCHQVHENTKKTCAECHEDQARVAATGNPKHQCAGCHPPHKPAPAPATLGAGPAWWTRCSECHAAKVESAKERGPKHSVCKNCHEPHKFGIPTCNSCHENMKNKGLHAKPKHAEKCSSCHDPHVKGVPTPAQCLACHTDRRGHQPDAKRCQACHLF